MTTQVYGLGSLRIEDGNQNDTVSLAELQSGVDRVYCAETGMTLTISQVQERLFNEFGITEFEGFKTGSETVTTNVATAFMAPGLLRTPTTAPTNSPLNNLKGPGAAAVVALVAAGVWMFWPGKEDGANPDADVIPVAPGRDGAWVTIETPVEFPGFPYVPSQPLDPDHQDEGGIDGEETFIIRAQGDEEAAVEDAEPAEEAAPAEEAEAADDGDAAAERAAAAKERVEAATEASKPAPFEITNDRLKAARAETDAAIASGDADRARRAISEEIAVLTLSKSSSVPGKDGEGRISRTRRIRTLRDQLGTWQQRSIADWNAYNEPRRADPELLAREADARRRDASQKVADLAAAEVAVADAGVHREGYGTSSNPDGKVPRPFAELNSLQRAQRLYRQVPGHGAAADALQPRIDELEQITKDITAGLREPSGALKEVAEAAPAEDGDAPEEVAPEGVEAEANP